MATGNIPRFLKQADEIAEPDPVHRNQRKRYPWWVRSVDEPTIAIDKARIRRMDFSKTTLVPAARFFTPENLEEMVNKFAKTGISRYIGVDKTIEMHRRKRGLMEKWLQDNPSGFNHADWALYYAAFSVQYNFSYDFYELTDKSAFVNVYERYGLKPWKASRLEASKKQDVRVAGTSGAPEYLLCNGSKKI